MRCLRQYKYGFDIGGFIVFLAIMLPNIIWFVLPAQNDIFRTESITPIIDFVGLCSQILMIAVFCCIQRRDYQLKWFSTMIGGIVAGIIAYYACWLAYYAGNTSALVVLLLACVPCFCFILLAVERKNWVALFFTSVFTICHVASSVVNFVI